jgi:hypothetical protein
MGLPRHMSQIVTCTRNGSATPTPAAMLVSRTIRVRVTSWPDGTNRMPLGVTKSSSRIMPGDRSISRIWRTTHSWLVIDRFVNALMIDVGSPTFDARKLSAAASRVAPRTINRSNSINVRKSS